MNRRDIAFEIIDIMCCAIFCIFILAISRFPKNDPSVLPYFLAVICIMVADAILVEKMKIYKPWQKHAVGVIIRNILLIGPFVWVFLDWYVF